MEALYNYILQSGLCLLLFYGFYMLVLRSFPRNGFKRLYLLLTPLLSLIIPLVELPMPVVQQYFSGTSLPEFRMPEVIVTAYLPQQATPTNTINLELILAAVYALAVTALLARLGIQLIRLRKLIVTATPVTTPTPGATILQTANYTTFAFLNYIFLNQQPYLSEHEQKQVLAHELAHVRLGHSYDVLYYEILSAILWFNPLVWLLKIELRDVHEYQADAAVVAEYQPDSYSSLLAKEALYKTGIPLGNHFYRPQVFKRLHMLRKRNQRATIVKPLLALPLLLLMLFLFSAKDVTADMVQKLSAPVVKQVTAPTATPTPAATPPEPELELETTTPTIVKPTESNTEEAPFKPAPAVTEPVAEAAPEQQPYMYVEQMPKFEGGEVELQKFIARNIRYPKATKEAGTAGLVVISFVVQPDGNLTDVAILKGLDEAADAEAERVVSATSGKWLPGVQNGKTVPVRFTLPVRFALTQ